MDWVGNTHASAPVTIVHAVRFIRDTVKFRLDPFVSAPYPVLVKEVS